MKTKFLTLGLIVICAVTFNSPAFGKERVVNGRITAFKVFAVNKASVLIKSTKAKILTDSTGYFSFKCGENEKLIISAHGFFPEKIDLRNFATNDSVNVDLRLKKGKKNIEYATGYGHISEKNLNYAIDHFESGPDYSSYTSILNILDGRVSGVSIGSNAVTIRGTNLLEGSTPALLVVDGTVVNFSVFSDIPPTQVKSIDVLKGAAASARYGSRGMGGVVIVKTKTGN